MWPAGSSQTSRVFSFSPPSSELPISCRQFKLFAVVVVSLSCRPYAGNFSFFAVVVVSLSCRPYAGNYSFVAVVVVSLSCRSHAGNYSFFCCRRCFLAWVNLKAISPFFLAISLSYFSTVRMSARRVF